MEGSSVYQTAPGSCLTCSTDPLDRALLGQDTFFLEQTKKKGVRVRTWAGVVPAMGVGAIVLKSLILVIHTAWCPESFS